MSAFLGPIHHWLFRKIQFQNELTNRILDFYDRQDNNLPLTQELKSQYGELEQQHLENIIDGANIHGWLQERVSMVESRLAYLVALLLQKEQDALNIIERISFEFGKEHKVTDAVDAKELFRYFDNILLDGMPCDHANEVVNSDEHAVTWKRNLCVHQQYWDKVGGDITQYYLLRDALIEGILCDSLFQYQKSEDDIYTLKRRT